MRKNTQVAFLIAACVAVSLPGCKGQQNVMQTPFAESTGFTQTFTQLNPIPPMQRMVAKTTQAFEGKNPFKMISSRTVTPMEDQSLMPAPEGSLPPATSVPSLY